MKKSPRRLALALLTSFAALAFTASAGAQSLRPNPSRCPPSPPGDGASCSAFGLECGYGPCGNYYVQRYTCLASLGQWSLVETTCSSNPVTPPESTTRAPDAPSVSPPGNPPATPPTAGRNPPRPRQ